MARSPGGFPELLLGHGLYKLGYVTNDREWAIAELRSRLGIETWVRFEPSFAPIRDEEGHSPERANLRCAFSSGQPVFVEVMEPVGGPVELWADALDPGNEGPQVVFHHVGVLVDDFDAVLADARERGLEVALRSEVPDRIEFAYLRLPALGHYVEVARQYGAGATWLDAVRSAELTPGPTRA